MANSEILNRKDPLTGFHTKEGLNEYLSSKMSGSAYEKTKPMSVIILDLDNFKGINDRFGHMAGDDALRFFSGAMNTALKGQHFVARYGGDEFVIVMFDSEDGRGGTEVGSRIKAVLNKERFNSPVGPLKIGSSIGISNYPHDGKTPREILEAADQALYYVKKHGRKKALSSRHIRAEAIRDKVFFAAKLAVVLFILFAGFFSYRRSESFKGVVYYYRNFYDYAQYRIYALLKPKNYLSLDLKDGNKIAGWIIREDSNSVSLSMQKPALRLGPSNEGIIFQPVKIPRVLIRFSAREDQ